MYASAVDFLLSVALTPCTILPSITTFQIRRLRILGRLLMKLLTETLFCIFFLFLSFLNYTRYFYAVNTEQMFLDHSLKVSNLQGILGNLTMLDKIDNPTLFNHRKRRFRNLNHLKLANHLSNSLSFLCSNIVQFLCQSRKDFLCVFLGKNAMTFFGPTFYSRILLQWCSILHIVLGCENAKRCILHHAP
jgi:hypothetical protein